MRAAMSQTAPVNDFSTAMPCQLGDGESVRQVHPEQEFGKLNMDQWRKLADGVRWTLAATWFMKVGVSTTVANTVESRMPQEMVEFFRDLIRSAKENGATK